MFMQSPASPTMEAILQLYDYISFFLVTIFLFVLWFFYNILIDFRASDTKLSPTAIAQRAISYKTTSRIVHKGTLEVVWTIIPVFILTAIAIPSFELLYALDVVLEPEATLKCIGNQWYWNYEYIEVPDEIEQNLLHRAKFLTYILEDSRYLNELLNRTDKMLTIVPIKYIIQGVHPFGPKKVAIYGYRPGLGWFWKIPYPKLKWVIVDWGIHQNVPYRLIYDRREAIVNLYAHGPLIVAPELSV